MTGIPPPPDPPATEAGGSADADVDLDLGGPGATLGPYRLLERLGEGGLGVVYLAEQTEPVRRRVALKILRAELDGERARARFEVEHHVLALLDHPNVARVLDAGKTDSGRPYIVIDYVAGLPITEYCDRHLLTVRQRLDLFGQVCMAIQHAHQKGIIHRDIKPSNVLVTVHDDAPLVKVIDFGIARTTNRNERARTFHTRHGQLIGTPEYMSPEQAEMSGLDLDTRSDIYSLGVLLHELLVGSTPFCSQALRTQDVDGIRAIIREVEPAHLPEHLDRLEYHAEEVARRRATSVAALRAALSGDLEWITLKALEKDRTRRYASTSELVADIERHKRDEPVSAGPPTIGYRVHKFLRRNRLGVASAAIVAVAAATGIFALSWSFVVAKKERNHAEGMTARSMAVMRFMESMLASVDPDIAGAEVRVIDVLDDAARDADVMLDGQDDIEAALRNTIGTYYMRLGRLDAAATQLQRALFIRQRVFGEGHPETLQSMHATGVLLREQGRFAEALERLTHVDARRQRALGREHAETLMTEREIGRTLLALGRVDEAVALLDDVVRTAEHTFGRDSWSTASYRVELASALTASGRMNEAEAVLETALGEARIDLGADHDETLRLESQLQALRTRREPGNPAAVPQSGSGG